MTILLRMIGRKILLMSAENAAGPMEIPFKSPINSSCWFPMKNCAKGRDCSSSGY